MFPIPPDAYRFADIVFRVDTPDGGNEPVKLDDSWDDLSPRFVLDYSISQEVMVFGSVSKGYKAGGYNSVEVGSQFDNEDVWNFEAGVKSLYSHVGVMLNASAFYYVYSDKQSISLVTYDDTGIPQYLIETSDEQAWGIDVEARWQPYDHVMLYANLAFIWATGFEVTEPPFAKQVRGRDGQSLAEVWRGSPQAHLGTMVAGFPNMFLMTGPNTGLAHSSMILMIESQLNYMADFLRQLDVLGGRAALDARAAAVDAWNHSVQERMKRTVWNTGGCTSWYLDANGDALSYPFSYARFRAELRAPVLAEFEVTR